MHKLIEQIAAARKITLTTHKNSDGDGIGSLVALYWGIKSLGKQVDFVHIDEIPQRYMYMLEGVDHRLYATSVPNLDCDQVIVLDTNQGQLCNPLYNQVVLQRIPLSFIDHHVPQEQDYDLASVWIRKEASSTGEIIYDLVQTMNIPISEKMATALYSSLTFDTQAFKLTRNSSRSHQIASELTKFNIQTDTIQRELFANWTQQKMTFLSELIRKTHYYHNNSVACIRIDLADLEMYNLLGDDVNDVIDLFTLIKSIQFCFSIRETAKNQYKLSFRSVGNNYAFKIAEKFGGGGHSASSGAWITDPTGAGIDGLEQKIMMEFESLRSRAS